VPISAQEYGIQASIGPDLIAHAKTGDAYANYVIAYKYFLLDVANDKTGSAQILATCPVSSACRSTRNLRCISRWSLFRNISFFPNLGG